MGGRRGIQRRHALRTPGLTQPTTEACAQAALILERTHNSADALLKAFEHAQHGRGAPRGMTTDDEQDLLRVMLVMAAAGLDSTLKQLIRDALPALVRVNPTVGTGLEKFVVRSIRGDSAGGETLPGARFLARVLVAESNQAQVIEEYIRDLTGSSLQSAEELARTAEALGLTRVRVDVTTFREIFDIRNKIIHELDINLEGDRRRRNLRRREPMMQHTDALLALGEDMVREVDERLGAV